MKKSLLLLITITLFSCSGVKKTQEAINSGDYNTAISKALEKLRENKQKKGNQPYVLLLEDAYAKMIERETQEIKFLQQEGNPANFEKIFQVYTHLKNVQQQIKPLLPLYIVEKNRQARFNFQNYSNEIIIVKNNLSQYLYDNAGNLLKNSRNKSDYRKAYEDLSYLDEINPDYKDVKQKIEEAHLKGTDFVKVSMYNDTKMIIPERLEDELLNFNTYGLDDIWTVYHSNPLNEIKYDYEMEVSFKSINISPEQVREKEVIKEKQIVDGWEYLKDKRGQIVKDSLGNEIKVDRYRTVRCNFYQFTQFKAVQVGGEVIFKDLTTKQNINSYPLSSEFVFEHLYADYDGDKRALEDSFIKLLDARAVPFPSNEQMVYDAGEDIKKRIKNIITRHKFN
ncbi:hypothetical protein [Abyssalbus ytuae]|uniref:Lipoprotein n=1 Tax=Abyssalbus ytuae TaxID=2926907 RepID=A0A9E7D1Z7_9FLAO|nr:hypothetical protein [Abyssalbus ytuae]UOB17633.1 hypothetical protein MQE35_18070 [Abyssalbus ytuae]